MKTNAIIIVFVVIAVGAAIWFYIKQKDKALLNTAQSG
jgi:hypothetical protein